MRGRKGPKGGPLILGRTAVDSSSSKAVLTALSVSLMHSASLLNTELVCTASHSQPTAYVSCAAKD